MHRREIERLIVCQLLAYILKVQFNNRLYEVRMNGNSKKIFYSELGEPNIINVDAY